MSDFLPWLAPYSGWTIMVLLALAGLMLARRGPRLRVDPQIPRCPNCAYDLSGAPTNSSRCPECGNASTTIERHLRRGWRWPWWIAGACVALVLPTLVVNMRVRQSGWSYYLTLKPLYWISPTRTEIEHERAGYQVRVITDRRRYMSSAKFDDLRLDVRRNGTTYFTAQDWQWNFDNGTNALPAKDVNGNGIEDLVASGITGGAHCCETMYIVELAPDGAKQLAEIPIGHGWFGFKDLNEDGVQEIVAADWTFAYWKTSFAGSPAPAVTYAWNGKTYEPNASLMHKPAPSSAELHELIAKATGAFDDTDGLGPLLGTMLDLIYTGHADLVYDFLDTAWPADWLGKEQFRHEFLLQLGESPYRDLVEKLGHPPLPKPSLPQRLRD